MLFKNDYDSVENVNTNFYLGYMHQNSSLASKTSQFQDLIEKKLDYKVPCIIKRDFNLNEQIEIIFVVVL